jgi:hypothetical protein
MNFLHLLTLIFVVAKLMEVINWSWWLVFAPSIIPIVLAIVISLIVWAKLR